MKKLLLIAVGFIMSANFAFAQIPDVNIENGKGEIISTSSLIDGKTPMILVFWDITTKSSIVELNAISNHLDEWEDEVGNFRVVAVSIGDSRSVPKAKAMVSAFGWDDYIALYDKNQEFKRGMNINAIPHVFVVDANGKIVYSKVGYIPGNEIELLKSLKKLKE